MSANAKFYSIDPAYQDPVDLGSGGASLTFATNEGMVFSNPALMPLGPKTFRWLGTRFSLVPSQGALDIVSGDLPSFDFSDPVAAVDELGSFDAEVGAGSTLLTFIMSNFAIVPIASDLKVSLGFNKFGTPESGTSTFEAFVDIDNKAGVAMAFSGMPARWFSLGVTAKALYVTEQSIVIPLNLAAFVANQEAAMTSLNETLSSLSDEVGMDQVISYDVGSLFFFQGQNIDYRIATVVRDVGGATVSKASIAGLGANASGESTGEKPQAVDLGLGVTLHNHSSFIHLAADVKDYLNAYGEPDFKRYSFGLKTHIMRWVALGAGIRHGHPTAGIEFDALLFRLSFSQYYEVLGDDPLGKKRKYNHVSFGFGTDF